MTKTTALTFSSVCVILTLACGGNIYDPTATHSDPPSETPTSAADTIDAGGNVVAIAAASGHVCWTSYTAGTASPAALVACVSERDGRRVEFSHDALEHPWIAIGGDQVFWSTAMTATIEKAPLAGGPSVRVVTRSGPHGRFVIARPLAAYWLVDGGTAEMGLFSAASDVEKPAIMAKLGAANVDLLAVDEWTVYALPAAYYFNDGVKRFDLNDGTTSAVSKGCLHPTDLVLGSADVLWSCEDGTFHWVPRHVTVMGEDKVLAGVGSGRIAPGDDALAYVTDVTGGRVHRVQLGAATSTVLAEGLDHPTAIAVDDSGVYVGDGHVIRRFSPTR